MEWEETAVLWNVMWKMFMYCMAREDCLMALVVSAGLYEPVTSITNITNKQNKLLLCWLTLVLLGIVRYTILFHLVKSSLHWYGKMESGSLLQKEPKAHCRICATIKCLSFYMGKYIKMISECEQHRSSQESLSAAANTPMFYYTNEFSGFWRPCQQKGKWAGDREWESRGIEGRREEKYQGGSQWLKGNIVWLLGHSSLCVDMIQFNNYPTFSIHDMVFQSSFCSSCIGTSTVALHKQYVWCVIKWVHDVFTSWK